MEGIDMAEVDPEYSLALEIAIQAAENDFLRRTRASTVEGEVSIGPQVQHRKRRLPPSFAETSKENSAEAAQKENNANSPFVFTGKVLYAFTALEVDYFCQTLLNLSVRAVGFDIECAPCTYVPSGEGMCTCMRWRVTFKTGQVPRKTALLQLCYASATDEAHSAGDGLTCLLLHIAYSGITPALAQILSSPELVKAGVGITQDALKLERDYNIQVKGLCCLSDEANKRLASSPQSFTKWSLAGLVMELMNGHLSKDPKVRTSDWEARPLTAPQIAYAAADAAASLLCYQALMALEEKWKGPPVMPGSLHQAGTREGQEALCHVAACPEQARLQPAKAMVYQRFAEGHTPEAIAAQRGVRCETVLSYLAEAILGGYAYDWHRCGVAEATLLAVGHVCREPAQLSEGSDPPGAAASTVPKPEDSRDVSKELHAEGGVAGLLEEARPAGMRVEGEPTRPAERGQAGLCEADLQQADLQVEMQVAAPRETEMRNAGLRKAGRGALGHTDSHPMRLCEEGSPVSGREGGSFCKPRVPQEAVCKHADSALHRRSRQAGPIVSQEGVFASPIEGRDPQAQRPGPPAGPDPPCLHGQGVCHTHTSRAGVVSGLPGHDVRQVHTFAEPVPPHGVHAIEPPCLRDRRGAQIPPRRLPSFLREDTAPTNSAGSGKVSHKRSGLGSAPASEAIGVPSSIFHGVGHGVRSANPMRNPVLASGPGSDGLCRRTTAVEPVTRHGHAREPSAVEPVTRHGQPHKPTAVDPVTHSGHAREPSAVEPVTRDSHKQEPSVAERSDGFPPCGSASEPGLHSRNADGACSNEPYPGTDRGARANLTVAAAHSPKDAGPLNLAEAAARHSQDAGLPAAVLQPFPSSLAELVQSLPGCTELKELSEHGRVKALKAELPEHVTYADIRLSLAHLYRIKALAPDGEIPVHGPV